MTAEENQLWKKISAFKLDDPSVDFTFSERLARENGWDQIFALRAIEEYKKFIFLCCVSKTQVTPSDQVDQAWHLHLTFTKSYWIDFCRNTLNKEIHHNPTKGGKSEAQKFDDQYSQTKAIYKQYFQFSPPIDIWPSNQTRFNDIDFVRINKAQYYFVKKPAYHLRRAALVFSLVILALFFLQATFSWVDVLIIIAVVVAVILLIAWLTRNNKDNSGCSHTGGGHGCGHMPSDSSGSGCSSSGCGGGGCGGGD